MSDTPTCHGVGLGETVHRDREIVGILINRSDANMFLIPINEVLVDFVRKDDNVLIGSDFDDPFNFLPAVYRTSWVSRGIENNHLGAGRHGLLKLGSSDFPLIAFLGLNQNGNSTRQLNHLGITHPVG